MNGEVSIRVRKKHFLLFCLSLGFILFLIVRSGSNAAASDCVQRDRTELFTDNNRLPIIYAITPTYSRPVQKAELTRISHVMLLVPNIHWIIVEDSEENTVLVKNFLNRTGLNKRTTLLHAKTPTDFKLKDKVQYQRNAGIDWLQKYLTLGFYQHSVVYFMEENCAYSLELFAEMSKIQPGRVGAWPVGLANGRLVQPPSQDLIPEAGYAVSVDLLIRATDASLAERLQLLANNGTQVLVWRVETEDPLLLYPSLEDPNWSKPRGVEQRNAALDWLRQHWQQQSSYTHCLVFFMDDDNVYSTDLFAEMAKIQPGRVGVWPVGLVGALYVEKPILDASNQVTGFNSLWRPERPFPVDMAGFAISGDLLIKHPEAKFTYEVQRGYQESEILRHVTVLKDLQPLAKYCTQILVWHTRTEKTKLDGEIKLQKLGQKPSDFGFEV